MINQEILRSQLRSSNIKATLPTSPAEKNLDNFVVISELNITTQILTKFKKSKRFEETPSLINSLHKEGMANKEISNYLNSNNIKTPTPSPESKNQ